MELELDADIGTLEVDGGPSGRRVESPPRPTPAPPTRATAPPAGGTPPEAELADTRPRKRSGSAKAVHPDLAARAAELANFGDSSSPLLAPAYAVRVWRRRSELAKETGRLRAELERREAEAEEAMARIGRAVRLPAADEIDLIPLVDGVARAEAEARQREDAVAAADASTATVASNADVRISQARAAVQPLEAEADRVAAQLKTKQDGVRRARAQLKRTEIEIRNLKDLANAKDTEALGQLDPATKAALVAQAAELRGRIPAEEAQRAAQEALVEEGAAPVAQLEEALGQVRRRKADAEATVARLEAERQKEITALDKARHDRVRVLESARGSVRSKLAELARAAVARGIAEEVAAPLVPEATNAAALAEATRSELQLYTMALGAFDRNRMSQGILGLGGAALLFLVLIFLLATC